MPALFLLYCGELSSQDVKFSYKTYFYRNIDVTNAWECRNCILHLQLAEDLS